MTTRQLVFFLFINVQSINTFRQLFVTILLNFCILPVCMRNMTSKSSNSHILKPAYLLNEMRFWQTKNDVPSLQKYSSMRSKLDGRLFFFITVRL